MREEGGVEEGGEGEEEEAQRAFLNLYLSAS